MEGLPRQKLRELVARFGRDLGDDPRRCEGLLRDVCGEHKREISVLVNAARDRVPAELAGLGEGVPPNLLFARLAKRLQENWGLTENFARWAVESWAFALRVD